MAIPEQTATEILLTYSGFNNAILEYKWKLLNNKNFTVSRTQAEYIVKVHEVVPKLARKYITLTNSFAEKLMEERLLTKPPKKIWCEKLLYESEKAYHIWGRVTEAENNRAFWLPKTSVVPDEKVFKKDIDWTKYDVRPPLEHQIPAIRRLLANDKYILADDMGLAKCLDPNQLVYTPNGKIKIKELKVDDYVIGSNGKKTKVIGVYPQKHLKDMYKITFNDGYSINCTHDHIWTVSSNNSGENNKNRTNRYINLTVDQMLDKELELKQIGYGWNEKRPYKFKTYYKTKYGIKWQIPIVKPIEFENEYTLPIKPYLMGLSLGDGHLKKYVIHFTVRKDDFDELFINENIIEKKQNKKRPNVRIGTIKLNESLEKLNINNKHSYDKFIPEIYKYTSIEDRILLLQGLMDTDGTCAKSKNNKFNGCFFTSVSEQLVDDVAEIIHSLGGIVRKSKKNPKYKYKGKIKQGRTAYILNIKLPENINPFKLKRKANLYKTPTKYKVARYIKNIEYLKPENSLCIKVDAENSLFTLEHGIVTHNTSSAIIATLESDVKKVLIICPASLKINWQREISIYTQKRILIVEGSKWGSTFDFYIINYDILKNYHTLKKDALSLIDREKFDLVIVDEAHNLANNTAQRTKLTLDIIEKIPKVWLLTGTPMTSRPMNYYNLLKSVDAVVTENWQHYVKRYCGGFQFTVKQGKEKKKIWNTKGATNLDELKELNQNKVFRRLKTEVTNLPGKIVSQIPLELENFSLYDLEFEHFIKIAHEDRENDSLSITISKLMAVRQIIANEKIPYTCEIIDKYLDNDKKVIVFTNFTAIVDELKEKYGKEAVVVDGRMSKTARQNSVDEFQNNPKVKVFIGNLIAAGAGLNLTAAEAVIMNDLSFVPAHHLQAEDRANRIGQTKTLNVYYPIFENTIEIIIYNIIQAKNKIINQVTGDDEYEMISVGKELLKNIL